MKLLLKDLARDVQSNVELQRGRTTCPVPLHTVLQVQPDLHYVQSGVDSEVSLRR